DLLRLQASGTTAGLALLGALGEALFHLLRVRVELRLVRRRQCRTNVRALGQHELLHGFALRRVRFPTLTHRSRVALGDLAMLLALELLAERLHLRRVLRVHVLDVRLLGVAQLNAAEERATTATPRTRVLAGMLCVRARSLRNLRRL